MMAEELSICLSNDPSPCLSVSESNSLPVDALFRLDQSPRNSGAAPPPVYEELCFQRISLEEKISLENVLLSDSGNCFQILHDDDPGILPEPPSLPPEPAHSQSTNESTTGADRFSSYRCEEVLSSLEVVNNVAYLQQCAGGQAAGTGPRGAMLEAAPGHGMVTEPGYSSPQDSSLMVNFHGIPFAADAGARLFDIDGGSWTASGSAGSSPQRSDKEALGIPLPDSPMSNALAVRMDSDNGASEAPYQAPLQLGCGPFSLGPLPQSPTYEHLQPNPDLRIFESIGQDQAISRQPSLASSPDHIEAWLRQELRAILTEFLQVAGIPDPQEQLDRAKALPDSTVRNPSSEDLVGHLIKWVLEFQEETMAEFLAVQQQAGANAGVANARERQWLVLETAKTLKVTSQRKLKDHHAFRAWGFMHLNNPYPNKDEKQILAEYTGKRVQQVTDWFTNWRAREWKKAKLKYKLRWLRAINFIRNGYLPWVRLLQQIRALGPSREAIARKAARLHAASYN